MPQDVESESELLNLAAVPWQLISPANNSPIIGIFQDSLLGCYRFTRENIKFNARDAMNLLMMFNKVNISTLFKNKDFITNFDILSQILPPISLHYKTKLFGDSDDSKSSNNVLEIKNGTYIRGQMEKSVLGGGTKGLIQRICNDYGNMASSKFIDDIQNIVTEYMKSSAYSVGISDLMSDEKTKKSIINVITEKKKDVKNLIDQTQIGVFENNTGKSNQEEFETQVNNVLNQAMSEAGKIGLKSLDKNNRFVIMVNAGSKGSELNISQMISCLGQQNVDGKRIPYGFDHRTLPHFQKFDDSPSARGFVESSYINGLNPQELFFHAMGGRIGLIDTAVKSVTWETPIIIIENQRAKYTEIGRWIDYQLDASPGKIQHFTERQMELMDIKNGDVYIPTTDEDGNITWGEVTAITRHDPGTAMYEIKTCGGRSVIVTESKSLLIWNSETKKLREMTTPEIKIGDCVPVTAELCQPPITIDSIDMTTYFPKSEYVYGTDFNKALDMMNDAIRHKIPAGWWNENNGTHFTLPYTKKSSLQRTFIHSNLNNIKNDYIYPYHAIRNNSLIPEKFSLNEENGIFIGLFLAEGNVCNTCIYITNNNENIQSFVKNWFDKHSIHWAEKSRINNIGGLTSTIIGNSSVLSELLIKMVGYGAEHKHVPTEAFIAPECFIVGLLNGYYSGDGTISKNSIEVGSASKRLIEDISMLCSRLGIFGKVFKTQMKSNNLGTKNIKPSYRFSIRAQWGKIFSEKIVFLEENKTAKMRSIVWGKLHRNFDTYNNVVLDKIVEINVIPIEAPAFCSTFSKSAKVYDLTIPSTLNFGLANGLQVRDTSTTGYIQRRLIKGLEDLMVGYDMTVRTNKNKVVQFTYGDDGIDPIKVENQVIPLVNMSIQDIYAHYNLPDDPSKNKTLSTIFLKNALTRYKKQQKDTLEKCKLYTDMMIQCRDEIIKYVFKNKSDSVVNCPVAFSYIINNIAGQQNINTHSIVDITPLEAYQMIEETYSNLEKIRCAVPTLLFKTLYYFNLSPKDILFVKRFNRAALTVLLETITLDYKRAIVSPGEMVGMIAAQSIGEPTTQMSLNFCEHIRCVKINKNTKNINMVLGEIGRICDELIEKLPQYTFNTGHHDSIETLLEPLDDEYYIIGVDGQEKTHWNKISHVSRHPVNGQMMKVMTKSGRIVNTTTSHSHLIRKDQTVVPITGSDMTVGMRIPVAKHIDNTFVKDFVIIDSITYQLDYLFGWFVGAYLAEGHLTKKSGSQDANGMIIITNISEYFINNTKEFAKRFDIECNIRDKKAKYGPSIDTSFSSKPLAEFLLETCNNGSFVKHIPEFAFLAPNEFKAGLIQAYFDGDGNFQSDAEHHQIRVCSRSKQMIKDVALLLNYFDIFATIKERFTRGSNIYDLSISPKYSALYKKQIGSLVHKEKLDELVDYIKRGDAYSFREDIDNINGLGEVIATCGRLLSLSGHSRNYGRWAKKETIGRRTLEKYIQIFESNANSKIIQNELNILKQAANSNVIWDEIVKIEITTPETPEYVYDFTVPSNQTFMTDYGVIVHNTLNSVIYETDIIIRNRDGIIKKMQIGEFIESNIEKAHPKQIEYYADKDTTYAALENYYEIPSCDEDGNILWKQIEAVTRHPVINKDGSNTMLKFTTDEEREVIVTKAKSLLKLVNGKIIGVDGDEFKVGDYLPVSTKQIDFVETMKLNLKEILPMTEYVYSSEVEKAKEVMNEYRWWSKHQGKTFTLPYNRSDTFIAKVGEKLRKRAKSKTTFQSGCVYMLQSNMCNYTIPEMIPMDYNFGYLIGAYAAEGCMTTFQMSIANNDSAYFAPILDLCEKWNITTKIYRNENKGKEGWTSQDLRIYNTLLCRILEDLCGKLSHNKFISDKIIFSNKECLMGFLDAYIGGDGSVDVKKSNMILMSSVSKKMLIDVQQILNNLGIYSFIKKIKKQETNNRGTLPENIHQIYYLYVRNKQAKKLASILNTKIDYKIKNTQILLDYNYKYEINKNYLTVPNEIDGVIVYEPRTDDKYKDILFDKIKNIEEVPNTTNYAYDLTVADTRTFNLYNGVTVFDTFHWAGVSSKSNVTRGVPRIEEILSLSSEIKNPSLTVYLRPEDETIQEKAQSIMYMLEHTKLQEMVKSVEVCFDPDDLNTLIEEDKDTMEQYRVFENMVDECMVTSIENKNEKSKWIIRMEMDPESMLEKNITMDDIHFTLKNSYAEEITCIYSDYNADKLVFRIRMNNVIKNMGGRGGGQKKIKVNPLDQSDQIYMLKNFQDQLLNNIIIRGIKKINKVNLRKMKDNMIENAGTFKKQDIWVLDTVGSNLKEVLALDFIDTKRTFTNNIVETFQVFGIEAARQTIYNELSDVIEFDGTYINYHHLAVLCDRMTFTSKMISIFRHGINNDNIGPIAKASFEETPEMFLKAARHAELDIMRGVSANVMCGQEGLYGTSAFQVILDLDEMRKLQDVEYIKPKNEQVAIDNLLVEDPNDKCSANNLMIQNNVANIKIKSMGEDNEYEPDF
jgi:DNA-directed RNA polymerase beta' subunit